MVSSQVLDFFSLFTKLLTGFNLFVSTPIYLSVMLLLFRRRNKAPFDSSFYTLFFALGLIDVSKYWPYVLKKCSYWGWVPEMFHPLDAPNLAAQLLYFCVWCQSLAQYQLNVLLSLNRFVSIIFPLFYRRHWSRSLTKLLLLAVAAIALSLGLQILWMPVCFRSSVLVLDDNSTMAKITGPVFMHTADLKTFYGYTKCFVYTLLAFCLVGYPLMFRRVRKMNMQDKSQQIEAKMFYSLMLLLVANLLYTCYFIIWDSLSATRPDLALDAEWALYVIVDFYDMNTPYGLLITSTKIRKLTLPCCLLQTQNYAKLKRYLKGQPQVYPAAPKINQQQLFVVRSSQKNNNTLPQSTQGL